MKSFFPRKTIEKARNSHLGIRSSNCQELFGEKKKSSSRSIDSGMLHFYVFLAFLISYSFYSFSIKMLE
jgi:hypothetical protein